LTFLLRYSRPAEKTKAEAFENIEVAIQHAETLKLLKSRISDLEAATSKGTVGAIVALAVMLWVLDQLEKCNRSNCVLVHRPDTKAWHFHMKSLRHVIRLQEKAGVEAPSFGLDPSLRIGLGC
jgi:hypothetical protein